MCTSTLKIRKIVCILCWLAIIVSLRVVYYFNIISSESTTTSHSAARVYEYGIDRAIVDLKLDPQRCRFSVATPSEKASRSCQTSATCPLRQFCHPYDKTCGNFCLQSNREEKSTNPTVIPQKDDVWIVSFPKSGSTWLRHLIWNLHVHMSQRSTLSATHKYPQRPSTFSEVDEGIPFIEDTSKKPMAETFQAKQGLRIFKSHQAFSCDVFPCSGWVADDQEEQQCECPNCASKFRRVIYIVRDGRPVMVSYLNFFDQLRLEGGRQTSFWNFLHSKKRRYPGVGWSDHVRSWMSAPTGNKLEILWVKYEDMLVDAAQVLRRVSKWLHIEADEASIKWAVQASSADSMSNTEKESGPGIFEYYKDRDSSFRMVHLYSSESEGDHAHKIPWESYFTQRMTTPQGEDPQNNSLAFAASHKYMLKCLGYPEHIL